jgi:hypothetical protein
MQPDRLTSCQPAFQTLLPLSKMKPAAFWPSPHFASSGTQWSSHHWAIGSAFLQQQRWRNNSLVARMQLQTLQSQVYLLRAYCLQYFLAPSPE